MLLNVRRPMQRASDPAAGGAAAISGVTPRSYYLDSVVGDDSYDGTGPDRAWRSLANLNAVSRFNPGDRILLRRGSRLSGRLVVRGSGTVDAPVTVDCYGEGDLPLLAGEGNNETLFLRNVRYWTVRHLAISNLGPTAQAGRCAVRLQHEDYGPVQGIVLQGLQVHDVNGSLLKGQGGGAGIIVSVISRSQPTYHDGLQILDCTISRTQRDGILFLAAGARETGLAVNVVVRGNRVTGVPGDGILVRGCDGVRVERNTVSDCPATLPAGEAAAGIWPFDCDNALIQYNEVSGHRAGNDGQGLDADYRCRNTVIQYNYTHDNLGGMALLCNYGVGEHVGNEGPVVRCNLSINDALNYATAAVRLSGPVNDARVYNNLIIVPAKPYPDAATSIFKVTNWGGLPARPSIHDNLVISAYQPILDMDAALQPMLADNIVYAASSALHPATAGRPGSASGTAVAVNPVMLVAPAALLERYRSYRPTLDQAIELVQQCFPEGKVGADALARVSALLPE